MKCVVLAAGKGTRMLPLTRNKPKHLIEVGGRPFLHYVLKNLEKAGFRQKDIAVVVGYMGDMIEKYLKYNDFGVKVIYQHTQMGTGHAVMIAEGFIGRDNFVLLNGDNIYSVGDLKKVRKEDRFCYVLTSMTENPERYGVVISRKGYLVDIIEKPEDSKGNRINTGLYKLTPEIFGVLKGMGMSPRGEYELTDAVRILAGEKKVKTLKGDMFLDFGCRGDVSRINDLLSK